jgi:NAD(P)-dependent dehydrogenase (short-subunit alcohol dehydrogenase family)
MTQRERTVIVSGGTGALGRAVVEAFLETGARVIVPWIDKSERDEVEALWQDALAAGSVQLVEADVTEESGALEVVAGLESIDVLVNAVGGFAGGSSVSETDLELWDQMFRINLRSAVCMSRVVLKGMRGRGAIVNIASRAAYERPAGLAAYSASKDAVIVLTETLQKELAGLEVRVNAVVPTTIDTLANREAMPDADFSQWTPPQKIARVIVWLTSADAENVRGGCIPV